MKRLKVRIIKRFLAIFLTFVTVVGLCPISAYATDETGNEEKETITEKDIFDNTAPAVEAFTVDGQGHEEGYEGGWTNLDVVIRLPSLESSCKIKEYQYKVVDASENNNHVDLDAGWVRLSEGDDAYQFEITEDTNATYYFRVASYSEEAGDIVSVDVKVQKTLPENAEVYIYNSDGSEGANGNNNWYVGIYPTIEIEEPDVSEYAAPVTTYFTLYNDITQETVSKGALSDSNWPEIEKDGRYVLTIWTEDEAGNECSSPTTKYFNVDTTSPTDLTIEIDGESVVSGGALSDTVSFDAFYDETISVKLAADCDISGQASLQYQKVRSVSEYDANGEWIDYDNNTGIVISPSEKFVIYFRAEDRAGNSSIIRSTGIVVDDTLPGIEITPESPNANGYYNGDVSVEISVSDFEYTGQSGSPGGYYSGLNTIAYRIYTTDTDAVQEGALLDIAQGVTSGAVYDSDGLVISWSGGITIDGATFNSNNVRVEITAVDNAGKTRTATTASGEIRIDMTDPTIDISYSNNAAENASYFNEDRTATIVITERNFDPSDVQVTIATTDGVIPTILGWARSAGTGNQDNTTWTATVTYSADGDYTFDISFTDLAGRAASSANYGSSVAPTEFTIDKTAPEITVSYDNNNAANGTYFNSSRTATVTIVERNFDVDGVEFTITAALDGKSIELPEVSWSGNGDTHTATIVYSYDGDFTFDVKATDIAGNESGEADYGSSVASKEFTIDQTYDNGGEPIIGGVEDGRAYSDEVIPTISFADINYSHYEISLYRTRKDEIDVDITDEKAIRELIVQHAQSISGELDVFAADEGGIHDVDDDGIYTLEVAAYDMAGNEYYDSATFTVNRFGSVYVYDSYLISLIEGGGAYVQKVTDDLVITEYNASRLIEDSLIIEITRDGRSIEAEYESDPVPNEDVRAGESGWFQYRHTISKDNFTDDGVYYIAVSSTDEASNTPESNTDNSTDDSGNAIVDTMQFRLDGTPPEITNITGLEEAFINGHEIDVRYTVYDAIGLGSVTVYVNGIVVQTIESFDDFNHYTGSFTMSESDSEQTVRIVVADLAGNTIDTDRFGETDEDGNVIVPMPTYDFNSVVTLTTNFSVSGYTNRLLFWGSISAAVAIAGLIWFLAALKRKKIL